MLRTLGTILVIIAIVAFVLLIALFIFKIVVRTKYGWPSQFYFYIIKLVTRDSKQVHYAVAYRIDGEYYRLRFHDYETAEDANKNVETIVTILNGYNTKKQIILASHHTDSERIIEITQLNLVPSWILKITNFAIPVCTSKLAK